jgi:hypothetical protein
VKEKTKKENKRRMNDFPKELESSKRQEEDGFPHGSDSAQTRGPHSLTAVCKRGCVPG